MVTGGILAGLVAALLQSCSYVFSRNFVIRHGNPAMLLFHSQLVMGTLGLLLLPLVMPKELFSSPTFIPPLIICALTYMIGQGGFFLTIREVEASRLSSLLGLKLLVLTGFSFAFYGTLLNRGQTTAIILCVAAALMMNWSGGKISLKSCGYLLMTLVGYSLSDMAVKELVLAIRSGSMIRDSLTAVALNNIFLGALMLPVMLKVKPKKELVLAAVPFACCWMGAMLFLFGCFATLGAVFGNVIQSSRGMMSVLISLALAHAGYAHLEKRVSPGIWIRRGLAALLMTGAIILYSYSH